MRNALLIIALGAIVVAALGMIDPSGTDPAANVAPVPRAKAAGGAPAAVPNLVPKAPSPLDVPSGSALETVRMLRARDFAGLTRRIEDAQRRVEADIKREPELFRALLAFDSADPTLTPLLDEWVTASSKTYAPYLARATHFSAVAWQRRGHKYSNKTTDEQRAGMRDYMRKSVEDARAALERNPKLVPAHRLYINAAMAVGDNAACVRLATQALDVAPASVRVRAALAECLLPRWGGSYEALGALAREAATHTSQNPALALFAGYVDWDRGNLTDDEERYDEAIALYTRAIEAGEYWRYYQSRAWCYYSQSRYTDALADLARAIALAPEEPSTLLLRGKTLLKLGRPHDAVPDIRLATELDPTDDQLLRFQAHENEAAAFEGFEKLEKEKNVRAAMDRLTLAIDLTGGNGEVFYRRGRVFLQAGDHPHALADFERAIELDPRHFEAYRNIDFVLFKRSDWDGIIQHWDRYIALEPMNGKAWFERSGTRHHKGDQAGAVADAKKACELGVTEACRFAGRAG